MELTELRIGLLAIFNISDIIMLGDSLLGACLNQDVEKYDAFVNLVPDLEKDWLQKIWQYYLADRENKKQDFTPVSISMLLAVLTGDSGKIVDLCAGSGALSIQAWTKNPERKFECYELDDNLIPFLVFNLAVRNMDACVFHGDCLTMEIEEVWHIRKGEKYATVNREQCKCDKQPALQHKMETVQCKLF